MKYNTLLACFLLFISTIAISQSKPPEIKNVAVQEVDEDIIFAKSEIAPTFPGGIETWTQYITEHMRQNIKSLKRDRKSAGTCRIKFIVDKQGNVSNVEALNMQNTKLAKIAIEAIAKGPRWIPAMQNGRRVKAFKEQLITFPLEEK